MSTNPAQAGVLNTILFDKVCQWLAAGWWFSPGTPVSSTNKIDCHDITEILLKVALNTIKPINFHGCVGFFWYEEDIRTAKYFGCSFGAIFPLNPEFWLDYFGTLWNYKTCIQKFNDGTFCDFSG